MSDNADLTPTQGTEQDEEAAMAAAFADVRGETPPAPQPEPAVENQAAAEQQPAGNAAGEQPTSASATPEPATEPAAPKELSLEERIAAIEAENRSLKQGVNSLAGRLGGVNQALQQLRDARAQHPANSQQVRAAQKIVAAQLKRVSADYPGLAESLADDLNDIMATPADGAAPPQIDVEAIKSDAEYAAVSRVERRLLERDHPNWEVDLALKDELGRPLRDASGRYLPSPILLEWLDGKPEHFRNQFNGAVDSDFLSSCIREFKEYRTQRMGSSSAQPAARSAPAGKAEAAPATSSKQARLAAAVTPRPMASATPPTPQLTEEQAMEQGFRSVRGS